MLSPSTALRVNSAKHLKQTAMLVMFSEIPRFARDDTAPGSSRTARHPATSPHIEIAPHDDRQRVVWLRGFERPEPSHHGVDFLR